VFPVRERVLNLLPAIDSDVGGDYIMSTYESVTIQSQRKG